MLQPTFQFDSAAQITGAFLREHGLRGLILDIDNTIAVPDRREIPPQLAAWLEEMRACGVRMVILSNNKKERVEDFAGSVGLPYVCGGGKPLRRGYFAALGVLGLPSSAVAAVGDQLFTDIWGGNRAGVTTILTKPFAPDQTRFIRFKRMLERPFVRKYAKRGR